MKKNIFLLSGMLMASVALVACNDESTEDSKDTSSTATKNTISEEQKKHMNVDINFDEVYSDKEVRNYAKQMIGTKAFDFSVKNLKGEELKLSDYKGQNVLIELASASCSACIASYPTVSAFKNTISPDELKVLTVFANDKKADVEEFFKANNYERDDEVIAGEGMNSIFYEYKVKFTPTFIYVDKEGYIQFVSVGSEMSETDFSLMSDTYLGTNLMSNYNDVKEMKPEVIEIEQDSTETNE